MKKTYVVRWEIRLVATSACEAAIEALRLQRGARRAAFDVFEKGRDSVRVDLRFNEEGE